MSCETEIARIRAFNRFYTRQIGVLDEGWLKSEFSLTEVRVLYELAQCENRLPTDLCRDLSLDPGYLSRILKKFESRGYVTRTPSQEDARQIHIALTDTGRTAYAPLEAASCNAVDALLKPLNSNARRTLVTAMTTVRSILDETASNSGPFIIREPKSGDIGWIIHRHGVLYHDEFGYDQRFEALVAEIAGQFVKQCDPRMERCWIAERDGEVAGSVFVVNAGAGVAKLRLLYVEPSARGLGIGRRLVSEVIDFAREKKYDTLTLWTHDVQVSAGRIYKAAGFKLVSERPHTDFGPEIVGQNWTLDLTVPK